MSIEQWYNNLFGACLKAQCITHEDGMMVPVIVCPPFALFRQRLPCLHGNICCQRSFLCRHKRSNRPTNDHLLVCGLIRGMVTLASDWLIRRPYPIIGLCKRALRLRRPFFLLHSISSDGPWKTIVDEMHPEQIRGWNHLVYDTGNQTDYSSIIHIYDATRVTSN